MANGTVEEILSRVRTLPTLPVIVYKLLKLIESPTSTAAELAEVIARDQALTARILRLVNSSFYALRSEVVKISHAIALLGFVAIKNLALGLSVVDMFGRRAGELDGEAFWGHSLCCATCARLIAEHVRYTPAEEAFVAGLLHDIGKLVMNEHFPNKFDTALRAAREYLLPLTTAERRVFETDHAELGAALAEHWHLPEALRTAIAGHHAPSPTDKLTNITYLANALAKAKQIGSGGDVVLEPLDDRAWATVGLDERTLIGLIGRLRREVERAKISLDLSGTPRRFRLDELDTPQIRIATSPPRRLVLVEEAASMLSLVELIFLDHGYSTYRTTNPSDAAAEAADLIVLDFSAPGLERARALRAEIEARLEHHPPVVVLPAPRRTSDVLPTVNAALAEAAV